MTENTEETSEINHSTLAMLSFNSSVFGTQLIILIFSSRLIFFYEIEVGLSIWLIMLGYAIYTAWDAFNDPFMGYLSDRPNRLWKKYGKRFPWIVSSSILLCMAFFLIFIPPDPKVNEWATFLWFICVLFLFDGLFSILMINRYALLPDKFRTDKERKKLAGFYVPFFTIGLIIGMMLPPLFITYGDKTSYVFMAIIGSAVTLVFLILSFPGMKEDEIMIKRAFTAAQEEKTPFFGTLKKAWKQKNFRIFVIKWVFINATNVLFVASTPYYVRYVLKGEAIMELYLYAAYLIPGVLLVPLWMKLGKKVEYVKLYPILSILIGITFLFSIFLLDIVTAIICVLFLGAFYGGLNTIGTPVDAEMFDEAAVLHGERNEGTYYGIQTVVGKIGQVLYIVILAIIHTLTHFDPERGTDQTALAIWGIRLQFGLPTGIFMLIAGFIFWKWWDLNPEKVALIREKLKQMNL